MASKLGAHHALRVDTRDPEEMARRVEEALGCKPDVSVECSGAEPSIQTGIYVSIPVMQCCVLCVWHSLLAHSRGGDSNNINRPSGSYPSLSDARGNLTYSIFLQCMRDYI